jgi:hypothetical protein
MKATGCPPSRFVCLNSVRLGYVRLDLVRFFYIVTKMKTSVPNVNRNPSTRSSTKIDKTTFHYKKYPMACSFTWEIQL